MFEIFTDPGIMFVMLLFIAFIVAFVFLRNFKPSDDSCIMDYDYKHTPAAVPQSSTPTAEPTAAPTAEPTAAPTAAPTAEPTATPLSTSIPIPP